MKQYHHWTRTVVIFHVLLSIQPLEAETVDSIRYSPIVAESAHTISPNAFKGSGAQASLISLPAIQPDLASTNPGPYKTGIVYPLTAPVTASELHWEPLNNGYAARLRLDAAGAKRLRYHVSLPDPPAAVEFRIQGNGDTAPVGPVNHSAIQPGEIWLPISKGDSADLEIFLAGQTVPGGLGFSIDAVNIISTDTASLPAASSIVPQSLGYTHNMEYDLACWASNPDYAALEEAAAATAKINFVDNGSSYQCTGTLLNDTGNTNTPWFATANHCLSNQAAASTAAFEWFFQATACGGDINMRDPRYAQTFGGAQLLWTDINWEASFLQLNQAPAPGAIFAGWVTQIRVNDTVWGVHHPQGDYTMVSKGHVDALRQLVVDTSQGGTHTLDDVTFTDGGTEPGSSGSGLFSTGNGHAYWKGTLFGGPVSNYQSSSYSDFPSYYGNIKQWLTATPAPTPAPTPSPTPGSVAYGGHLPPSLVVPAVVSGSLGDPVVLNAGNSSDPNPKPIRKPLKYHWSFVSGPAQPIMQNINKAKSIIVAPRPGTFVFDLQASNANGLAHGLVTLLVPAAIQLTSPLAGSIWNLGQPGTVSWNVTGINPKRGLTIYLSIDGGARAIALKSGIRAGLGSYTWKARRSGRNLGLLSDHAVIRVCLPKTGHNVALCSDSGIFSIR